MSRPSLGVTRVEVKIFDNDRETMIKHYGNGWTGTIRELVKNHCLMIRATHRSEIPRPLTVGDLADD
jgi:hypothetical protein